MVDLQYDVGTDVLAIRTCYTSDGKDLLAIAGEDSVEVLQCSSSEVRPLAFFNIGLRTTAIAWSPRTVSPDVSDDWLLELVISTHDFGLHLLTKSEDSPEDILSFGGGLTGHHGRINDITFVGGQDDNARHVATVSDDKNLIVWDLRPKSSTESDLFLNGATSSPDTPPQPTALVLPFAYPLCSISSHATSSKEFIVSDCRGSLFVVDWRKDPSENEEEAVTHQNFIELVHPRSLADAVSNIPTNLSGYASWHTSDPNIIGAVLGTEFALWDLTQLKGGKPFGTGSSLLEDAHRFRWCPSYPEFFAIASSVSNKGAVIVISSVNHWQTPANPITIEPRPHRITDFDWLATQGVPRIAAAVGRKVYIFPINMD